MAVTPLAAQELRQPWALPILGASLAFSAAPNSVAGLVYHEESVTMVRSNMAFGRVLNSDGTYRGIYFASTYGTFRLGSPVDGTWSYRKTGENTAELVSTAGLVVNDSSNRVLVRAVGPGLSAIVWSIAALGESSV